MKITAKHKLTGSNQDFEFDCITLAKFFNPDFTNWEITGK